MGTPIDDELQRFMLQASVQACDVIVKFAAAQQWNKCALKIKELQDRFGVQALGILLVHCADVQLRYQGIARDPDNTVQPVWIDPATGEVLDADQVDDDAKVWAGRFVAARAANDKDSAQALLRTTETLEQSAARISAVLSMTAHVVREGRRAAREETERGDDRDQV